MVVEENTPKKRLCSRVAQVAEAGPEGVQEVEPNRSSRTATQGPARGDHAIGLLEGDGVLLLLLVCTSWLFLQLGCCFD